MKVRIVKCSGDYWYKNQINAEFYVTTTKEGSCFNLNATNSGISEFGMLKEDCEILEADELKPEPFDLERALKGEPFLLKGGAGHLWYLVGKCHFDFRYMYKHNYYIESILPHCGTPTTHLVTINELDSNYEMAPREPEYQTVWVNLYDEKESNDFIAYAYSTKEDAMRAKAENFYIGTFPITFKKPKS